MSAKFVTSLPRGLENTDFRVLADEGGYHDAIASLYKRPTGTIAVTAQRDSRRIFLEVSVVRDKIAIHSGDFYFDGFTGELLDSDGHRTGNFVTINHLRISARDTHEGDTVGVLKMKRFTELPEAI